MGKWKAPITADGKWRVTADGFFTMPILPSRIEVFEAWSWVPEELEYLLDEQRDQVVLVSHTNDYEDVAPRLDSSVYKYKDEQKWFVLWCHSATWENKFVLATRYRPIMQIKSCRA